MSATSSVGGKLSKKERDWIVLLRKLKGQYNVNFDQHIHAVLSEAGFVDDQIDERFFSTQYVRQPHENGVHNVSVGFSRFGHLGATTKKVMDEISKMNRYCGTLHVGLAIAREHPVIEMDIQILLLGTTMQFSDKKSSGWAPLIELGPNTRRLTMVYRAPVNKSSMWSGNIQHLGFQIMDS